MAKKSKKAPLITHKSYFSVESEANKRLHALSTLNHTALLSVPSGGNHHDLSFIRTSKRDLNQSAMQPNSNSHLILDESKAPEEAIKSGIESESEEHPKTLFESMRINGQNGLI